MNELSQNERIFRMLKKAGSNGVCNYEFPKHNILRYSARIGELRKDYDILCERVKLKNGRSTNVFKYILIGEK